MPIDYGAKSSPPRLEESERPEGTLYVAVGTDLRGFREAMARLPGITVAEAEAMKAGIQRELAAAEERARLGALPPPTCPVLEPSGSPAGDEGGDDGRG